MIFAFITGCSKEKNTVIEIGKYCGRVAAKKGTLIIQITSPTVFKRELCAFADTLHI